MTQNFKNPEQAKDYVLGGRGSITVRSKINEKRFTYKFGRKESDENSPIFVLVLGSDDQWTYLGFIGRNLRFWAGRNGKQNAFSFRVFNVVWKNLTNNSFGRSDIWHEGMCGRCGRTLTVPESIEAGIGPVCATMR